MALAVALKPGKRIRPARYPLACELTYKRQLKALVAEIRAVALDELQTHGPLILAAASLVRPDSADTRLDDEPPEPTGWAALLRFMLERIGSRISTGLLTALGKVRTISRMTEQAHGTEWRRQVREWLGVDIVRGEPGLNDLLSGWEELNLGLIRSIPDTVVGQLRTEMTQAFVRGTSLRELTAIVRDRTGVADSRAELIARDQIGRLNGQLSEYRQRSIGVTSYRWRTMRDERVRKTHRIRDGKTYRWDAPGIKPGSEIRCFPGSVRFDLSNGCHQLWRRIYAGELAGFVASDGSTLEATPNHPVLTGRGWVPIGELQEGDYVVKAVGQRRAVNGLDVDDLQPSAEQLFKAIAVVAGACRTRSTVADFHGDGAEGEIDAVLTDSLLRNDIMSSGAQQFSDLGFARPDLTTSVAHFGLPSPLLKQGQGLFLAPDGIMRSGGQSLPLFIREFAHADEIGAAAVSDGESVLLQDAVDDQPRNVKAPRQGQDAFPAHVGGADVLFRQIRAAVVRRTMVALSCIDPSDAEIFAEVVGMAVKKDAHFLERLSCRYQLLRVVQKSRREFSGHVYNQHTVSGWYLADSFVSHNCRCIAEPILPESLDADFG